MMIGDRSIFAIESNITQAYESASLLALGSFVIYVAGQRYGVHSPDATLLGCSFEEVENRIANRGRHIAPSLVGVDAGKLADAFREAVYSEEQNESYLGIPRSEFCALIHSSDLVWAPDGDEAFDDSSYVLQFDVDDRVRLIAFKSVEGFRHDPASLGDVWLSAAEFYRLLQEWHDAFEAEWVTLPKMAEEDGGQRRTTT